MKLPLESITVSKRRREDFGDIAGLAQSISTYGLFHPIVVDAEGTLVAGERRLRAVQSLGWETVEVRDLGELSEAERDEIELEENLQRKDLTPVERSRTLVKLAETAKAVLREEAELRTDSVQKPAHRPSQPDSSRAVSERIGIPPQTIREAQQHVDTAEQYPELQAPGWKQYHVLEAREKLEKLSEPERPKAVALISRVQSSPRDGVEILNNLAAMPTEQREHVFELAESPDSRDRSLAITEAAKRPPMPDPRVNLLIDADTALGKAERMFRGDPMNDRITVARTTVKDALASLKEYRRDA